MLSLKNVRTSAETGIRGVPACVVAALAMCAHPASAQTPLSLLQAGLNQGVADGQVGAIGLVRQNGVSQYAAAGKGNQVPSTAADPTSKFRIGSNTKAFTSTVVLQLEAEGKLSLNDTVAKWLPGAVNANGNDGTQITIKQLLNMTSGIPDYLANSSINVPYALNTNAYQTYTPQQLVNVATSSQPTNAPGAAYHYSNTNYILAAMIVQAVTGNNIAQEVQTRIITPLGLTNTSFPTTDPTLQGNYMHAYNLGLQYWPNYNVDVTTSNVQMTFAAGAIVSTLSDLATFEHALFAGNLLPPTQQQELTTLVPTGSTGIWFGLGVSWTTLTGCAPVWVFNGEVLGYLSSQLTSADGNTQVVTVTNGTDLLLAGTTGQQDIQHSEVAAYCAMNP
jgi:D-alanyl-D-alanine carboxypeptidase